MPRLRHLVPLLAAAVLAGGEPLTVTAWDVRKDAEELLDELAKARGESGDLLQRTQAMLAEHGDDLIPLAPGVAGPLSDAVAERLRAAGLAERFAADVGPTADRRLAELLSATPAAAQLARLARSAPGTPAAQRAWRLAADLAWDRGALRFHALAAAASGESGDPARKARLAEAVRLLQAEPADLPPGLDQLDVMWRVPLAEPNLPPALRQVPNPQQRATRPGLSACGGAMAMSDGTGLVVIDHLVGNQLGPRIPLGEVTLPDHVARPEAVRDGAVAIGLNAGRLIAVCAGPAGGERWRFTAPGEAIDAVSAPVAADGLIAIAYRSAGNEQLELRMLALAERDGSLAWDVPVAHLATPRWGAEGVAGPALARHARGFAVCSNAGTIALVGCDGRVQRLWTYPTRPDLDMEGQRRGRRGLAASDGSIFVATPADLAGQVLVLGPEDATPRAYRGDGADGDVIAVHGGDAVIAGRQVAQVDTRRLRLRWTAPLRLPDASAVIGSGRLLVASLDQMALLDLADGKMAAGRALNEPAAIASADGILVVGARDAIRGFGDAGAFLERLRAAAAGAQDAKPHAALASVLAGRGEHDAALAAWRQALACGGGPGIAERMARLLRSRITAGGAQAAPALAELAGLAAHLPGLASETTLWRALLHENAGELPAATAAYAAALAGPDHLVPLGDGLAVGLRLLAAGGALRCGRADAWPTLTAPPRSVAAPASAWRIPARTNGRTLVAGDTVCAYAAGLLRAWSVADGRELWRRTPQRALLGVQPAREASPRGVAIGVLPGSAAESCGLVSGDVLLTLNGTVLRSFEADLKPMVIALGNGAAFTFTVLGKDGKQRTVSGSLGGEPMEPMVCDGSILLARTTMPLSPNRSDLRMFAIDPSTGADLWSHALSQDEERLARTVPLLAAGLAIVADGPDLVAFRRDGSRAWQLPGRSDLLRGASVAGRALWMPGSGGDGILLDPVTGAELAALPTVSTDATPAIAADGIAVRQGDERVAVWDLARGRLRCRTAGPARPLALRQDALLVLDARSRPQVIDGSTGAVRRMLAEMPAEVWAVGDSLAVLALAGPERRSLLGVALDGMVARWSIDLPPGLEIESIVIGPDGPLVQLREGVRAWAVQLGIDGQPAAVGGWLADGNGGAAPLGRGALAILPGELRVVMPQAPAPGPALRCTALDGAQPMREAVAASIARLHWSAASGPAVALARHGITLVAAVRTDRAETTLRLVDPAGFIATDAARALVGGGQTRLTIPGGWTLGERWTQPDPGGGPPIACSAWTPLPSRAPGAPLAVLLDQPGDAPWWLLSGWSRVLDPP